MPFYLLILILIFAPLAYGTTGPIAMTVVQALVWCGLLWVSIDAVRGRTRWYQPPGLLPLGLLAGLMVVQMVPLPPEVLQVVSPITWQRYAQTVWLLQSEVWMPLTISVERSAAAFSYYLTCVGMYLLATQCLADSRRLKRAVRIVTAFAGLYALVSILEALVPNGRILWILRPWPEYASQPFGSYVNGNHFAGLMVMLLPLCFMLYLVDQPAARYGNFRERLIDFCGDPRLGSHMMTGFAALLSATAIFLSLSRGGILSMFGSMLVLCLLLLWRKQYRRQALILIGFIVLLFFFVGLFGWSAIFETFAGIRNLQGEIDDGRLSYWSDCLALFRDFPFLGTGFGSFIDSYAGYQTLFQGEAVVDHAHNEYIELLAEAGLAGMLLAMWAAFRVLRGSWQAFARRRSRFATSLYLGCLAGVCALLLHSLTEFNLHIGANGLYFAFVVALLVALSSTSSRRGSSSELKHLRKGKVRLVAPLVVLLLLASLVLNVGGLVAEVTLAPFANARLSDLEPAGKKAMLQRTRKAISWAPLASSHHDLEAGVLVANGAMDEALQVYGRILRLRPLNAFYLQRTATLAQTMGRQPLAGELFKSAVELDRVDLRRIRSYAEWLLQQQHAEQAYVQIRHALQMAPHETRAFINLMLVSGVPSANMKEAMPDRALAWQTYATYLVEVKLSVPAEQAFRRAMQLSSAEERPSYTAFWTYYKYLEQGQRYNEAVAVILQGLELFPDNANLHAAAGLLYERQQILYRAAEEYRQALLLNPKLAWVRARLDRL